MGRNALSFRARGLCRSLLRSAALAALILATGPGATPQSANPPEVQARETTPQFRIRAERNLVLVRVVVRDANGRTIGDLHKGDFRLLDDGKPQEITGFTVEVSKPKPEAAPTRVAPSATAVAPPPVVVPQRFVGLFFDDFHTEIEGIGRTRDAAWSFVTKSVRPQDRVAIFTATGKDQLDFTADQAKLKDALFRLAARPHPPNGCPQIDDYEAYMVNRLSDPRALFVLHRDALMCSGLGGSATGGDATTERSAYVIFNSQAAAAMIGKGSDPSVLEVLRESESEAAAAWTRAEMESQYALQAIENSVRRLAAMPGQRSLVLVSPGFLTETQGLKVDAITDRALQQQVVISAIDAAGLDAQSPHKIMNGVLPEPDDLKDKLINMGSVASSGVLAYLSADTGGVFFHNNNDLDEGFREAAAVPEAYYVLTFSPQDVKLNGKFHSLKVTLNTPAHYTVQARRGYLASETTLVEQAPGADQLQRAIFSLDERHDLPAEVSTKVEKLNDQKSKLIVSIHVDISSLRYRKEAERSVDKLIFNTTLFDQDGKYVTGKESLLELHLKDASLEKFAKSGINAKTSFEVGPGTYRVREVVRDSEATGMSALNCEVEVPGASL
jgi:VWFA-related protein